MKPSKNTVFSRRFTCFAFQPYVFPCFFPDGLESGKYIYLNTKLTFRRVIRSPRLKVKYTHCIHPRFFPKLFNRDFFH